MFNKYTQATPLPSWVAPGWYPDPLNQGAARYWDGYGWSKQHRDAPAPDPLPAGAEEQFGAVAEGQATQDDQPTQSETLDADTSTPGVPAQAQTPKEARKAARAEAVARGRAKRKVRGAERQTAAEASKAKRQAAAEANKAARTETAATREAAKREMEAKRGPVVAKFSPGLTAIRIYRDGTIESKMHGKGSIRGATARVDQAGNKSLTKDTRQTYLTIEGPEAAISAKLSGNSGSEVGSARKFAAAVNQLAQQLNTAVTPPVPPPASPQPAPPATPAEVSIPDQISKLAELRDRGILTEGEFATKKAELLERM